MHHYVSGLNLHVGGVTRVQEEPDRYRGGVVDEVELLDNVALKKWAI